MSDRGAAPGNHHSCAGPGQPQWRAGWFSPQALVYATLLALAGAAPLSAQIATGHLYGVVTDESGGALPGVAVTLAGEAGTRSTVSGSAGRFRLLNVERGSYRLRLALSGFSPLEHTVTIVTGENVELTLAMKVGGFQEAVSVSAESSLVSTRKQGTATTLTTEELDHVPTPRDPWGLMRSVPGVLTDRVNIAGNESGQQSGLVSKGTTAGDTSWSLDGLEITDMASAGPTTYFDFGAFEEFHVSTGAADLRSASGGLGIHMTTRRGTNAFHGGARVFFAHDDLQSGNLPDELVDDPRVSGSDKADHIQQITEIGFDLGGPILRDRLWFYVGWGEQDIRLVDLTQVPDRTVIAGWNAKLSWQASASTMVSAFWFLVDKRKYGRTGWPGGAADSYRFDQKNASTPGGLPPGLWKLQLDHTVSPSLFLSARLAHQDTGFGLFARGPDDQSFTEDYAAGEARGTIGDYVALHPNTTASLDGHGFLEALGGHHELKFGFAYRSMSASSTTSWAGNQLAGQVYGPGDAEALVFRDGVLAYGGEYWSAYAGDSFSRGRLTLNLGLRWDGRGARNEAGTVPANASFPGLLPALSYAGSESDIFSTSDLSPRLGLSVALDERRHTVLRASYADYAQRLSLDQVLTENPVLPAFLAYPWQDADGDGFVQPGEVRLDRLLYSWNVDPIRPADPTTPVNKVDRSLRSMRDREVVIGLDHELAPGLAIGAAFTWRQGRRFKYSPWLAGPCDGEPTAASCPIIGPGSYAMNAPVTANGYTAFTYSPDPQLVAAGNGGRLTTNRPGYTRRYNGLELTLTRRLSRGFMGRLALSWNDWVEHFEGTPVGGGGNPGPTRTGPLVDGGQVARAGKNDIYSSVKWQLYANAMVQLPWRFELSGAVFGRQGHPYPKFLQLRAGRDGNLQALAQPRVDEDRYRDVWDLDLRFARPVTFRGATLTLAAELFNVFNSGVVLKRNGNARATVYDRIDEVLSPRILRLGARITF